MVQYHEYKCEWGGRAVKKHVAQSNPINLKVNIIVSERQDIGGGPSSVAGAATRGANELAEG